MLPALVEVWRTKLISSFSSRIVARLSIHKLCSFALRSREGGVSRPEEGERGTRVEVVRGAKGLGRAKAGVMGVVGIMGGEVSFSIERASANNQKQYIKKEGRKTKGEATKIKQTRQKDTLQLFETSKYVLTGKATDGIISPACLDQLANLINNINKTKKKKRTKRAEVKRRG